MIRLTATFVPVFLAASISYAAEENSFFCLMAHNLEYLCLSRQQTETFRTRVSLLSDISGYGAASIRKGDYTEECPNKDIAGFKWSKLWLFVFPTQSKSVLSNVFAVSSPELMSSDVLLETEAARKIIPSGSLPLVFKPTATDKNFPTDEKNWTYPVCVLQPQERIAR